MINPQIEEPKSGVDSFTLPCGYLDSFGTLHTSVEVREMTGDEEEILAAKHMPIMKKLNTILARCTTAIGSIRDPDAMFEVVQDLTQGDRVFLLFAIRRVSLGNDFPLEAECPKCEAKSRLTVDLSDLEIRKMEDPKLRTYEITLPRDRKVAMKVLTGRGEEAISKASTAGKDVISTAIMARIDAINGLKPSITDLKSLSLRDRNQIRDVWQDKEGGIDTAVEIQCHKCEYDYETDVDMASTGFFNPLAVQKAWRNKS